TAFFSWQSPAVMDHECLRESCGVALMGHMFEPAERIRIHQRPVFPPRLDRRASLRVMQPSRLAVIFFGKKSPLAIELQTESVAAALSKDFELLALRLVPPDCLAQKPHALHLGRACPPGCAIQ